MSEIRELHKWHKTKSGLIFFGLLELIVAYFTASWAIDSANLWAYFFTFVFIIGGVRNLSKVVHQHVKGSKRAK